MGKRILLIGGNFYPEPTGIGKFNGEMMDWLSSQGYTCTVVTTFPYYPYWKVQAPYSRFRYWFKKETRQANVKAVPIEIIRCPHYVPQNPSGLRRMISDFSFFFSAYLVVLTLLFTKKYDYVINVAPPFQLGLLGVLYKKIKGSEFICHIQDLQIDAASELGMIKSPFIIRILFKIEKYILKNADEVSSISAGMMQKVADKSGKKVLFFPNWADMDHFYPIADTGNLKSTFGFSPTDKIVLYSGAIGHKQGLEAVLEAAQYFRNNSALKFVICGSGPYKENLVQLKSTLDLPNVIFFPLQPAAKFNAFLNMADIHLILQKANASDLVMPSKLTTILSVGGLALVTASEGTSLFNLVTSAEVGIVIEPEDQEVFNTAIEEVLERDVTVIKSNARWFAEKNLSIDQILRRFTSQVFEDRSPGIEPVGLIEKKSVRSQFN